MQFIKKIKVESIFILVVSLGLLIFFVRRLFFGVETTDESYYIATGIRMMKGNVPFGDMWEVNAAESYLMLPFLLLRSLFTDKNVGLFLYMRLCTLIPGCIGAGAVFFYAKKSVGIKYAFLLGLMFLFYAPYQIYNFSYNILSILFTTTSVCMILTGIECGKKRFFYIAGISIAFSVMVYPTMIYCCVLLMVFILARMHSKEGFRCTGFYIFGGITVAGPIILHLVFTVGLGTVFTNLRIILSSGSDLSIGKVFSSIMQGIRYLRIPFFRNKWSFCLYFLVIVGCAVFGRTKRISKFLSVFLPIVSFYFVSLRDVQSVTDYIFPFIWLGPVAVLLANDRKKMAKKFVLEWGLSIMVYFVIAFSSSGGISNAPTGLIFTAIVSMKLFMETIFNDEKIRFDKLCSYILLFSSLLFEVGVFYCETYRDAPISELTEKVETGVYKGLYTTPERKQHLSDLEDVLKQVEDKGESVMILYHSCYAYLMVDMVPKTPSTWGCVDSIDYGFDNQQEFMDYLAVKENVPDNIFILDIPQKYAFGGQALERYEPYYPELNQFIHEYYSLTGTYEKGSSGMVKKYELVK